MSLCESVQLCDCVCALLHAWQSSRVGNQLEVPAKFRAMEPEYQGKTGGGGGGEQRGFSSETMETKLGHCTNFFFYLVKAGVCINVPTFPYQRCSRPSSHVALLFISLLSFDWLLQGQH